VQKLSPIFAATAVTLALTAPANITTTTAASKLVGASVYNNRSRSAVQVPPINQAGESNPILSLGQDTVRKTRPDPGPLSDFATGRNARIADANTSVFDRLGNNLNWLAGGG
jgi:hypothetical protein